MGIKLFIAYLIINSTITLKFTQKIRNKSVSVNLSNRTQE